MTMTRPDVRALLDQLAAAGGPGVEEQTPQAARDAMRAVLPVVDLPMPKLATVRELSVPAPHGSIPALLLDPRADRDPGPVVVWYHGGGFVTGGIDTHRGFAADLTRRLDLPVVLVDYRLAPEAPYPAAPDDAETAARWVAASPPELGRTADALILGGDSAGGTLAIVTAMALRDTPAPLPVLAQLVIYPATDLTRRYPSHQEFAEGHLLTEAGRRWYYGHYRPTVTDVRASPLLGEPAGLPPAVVLTAGLDPVRDEGRAYAAALVAAGVPTTFLEAEGNVHAFVLLRRAVPSSQADIADALTALRAVVDGARRPVG
ncbi:alpha/beta hydrolase [Streptomyces gibsoniae]|uniref:Alpha/beta hydrolase n=1 Tax=Streptomyces gibsoniae TaxID=3075529 RepID=A0ABU2TME5_9ACTN|nr:alpha/beta hydrolase [Streptomyces sp. DSM 41699]MDT0462090.1 alpha/beta hydrolase [Streptomyces sp. DSM 41699]